MTEKKAPRFSVVIATYNRCQALLHTLRKLSEQTYTDFEVVVVVDGSQDDTAGRLDELTAELPYTLRYHVQANAGPACARNQGVRLAQGDYILFIDDDIEAQPQLLQEHAASHSQGPGRVVIGVTPAPTSLITSAWAAYEDRMLTKHYEKVRQGVWSEAGPRLFYTGNASLARPDFWGAGGFDEKLRRGEDIELGYRLQDYGLKFVLNQAAVGLHLSPPRSLTAWKRIPYQYGRLDARLDLQKDRAGLIAKAGAEFHDRHALTRSLTRLCLDHPWRSRAVSAVLSWLAQRGKGRLPQLACSALFNLNSYQGMVDEMGAVEVWWANTNPTFYNTYVAHESQPLPALPAISVIVRANGPASECVNALLAQDYPQFEVIVVDQSAGSENEVALPADPRLKYSRLTRPCRNQALNQAVKLATNSVLALLDGDCRPAPGWLQLIGQVFRLRPEVGAVAGSVAPGFEVEQDGYAGLTRLGQEKFASSANLALRREVFDKIGPLDEQIGVPAGRLPGGDETDLAYRLYRAGAIVLQTPRSRVERPGAARPPEDNLSRSAVYTKYLRLGDLKAAKLLLTKMGKQPLATLRGIGRGLTLPLDRQRALFKPVAPGAADPLVAAPPTDIGEELSQTTVA